MFTLAKSCIKIDKIYKRTDAVIRLHKKTEKQKEKQQRLQEAKNQRLQEEKISL